MLNLMGNVIPETARWREGSWTLEDQPAQGGFCETGSSSGGYRGHLPAELPAACRESVGCDWRDVAGGDNELGSVGRGDWPRPAAVRMQAGCSGPHLRDDH